MKQYIANLALIRDEFSDVVGSHRHVTQPPVLLVTQTPSPPAPAPLLLDKVAQPLTTAAVHHQGFAFPPASTGFHFVGGATAAPPPATTGGFTMPAVGFPTPSFGAPSFEAIPAFGFPAASGAGQGLVFASSSGAPAAVDDEDAEPERPPSPSLVKGSAEDEGERVLFESKTKLFFLQSGSWSERGVGRLQLRCPLVPSGATSARLLVRNDTGKLLLNAKLYAGLKVTKKPKCVVVQLFNAAAENAELTTPVATMLRLAADKDSVQLHNLLEENIPRRAQ